MFINQDIYDTLVKKYKQTSINTYSRNIKRCFKEAFKSDIFAAGQLIKYKTVMKWINGLKSKRHYLFTVILVYEAHPNHCKKTLEKYKNAYNEIKGIEDNTYKPATDKQNEESISREEIISIRNNYDGLATNDTGNITVQIRRLITHLYSRLPPLRSQDFITAKFGDAQSVEGNYIDIDSQVLVIREGKTEKEGKERRVPINDELAKVIRETKERVNSRWLIPTVKDITKPMSNSGFNHFCHNIFGKHISSSRLRNLFVSELIDKQASAEQLKTAAKIMGHEVNTQQTIYTKHSKVLHPDKEEEDKKPFSDILNMKINVDEINNNNNEDVKAENERLKTELEAAMNKIHQLSQMVADLTK